jgi:hypothetical protein
VNITTRNYLICDAFSATFSENITNVHCNPEHCDDLLNSSRFYDVFLFFITDVHWSPKHYSDLFNLSRFYDIFLFFATNTATSCLICRNSTTYSYFSSWTCIGGYWSPNHHDDLLNLSQYGPQHHDVLADSSRSVKKQPPHHHLGPTTLPRRHHLTQVPHHHHVSAQGPPHCHAGATSPRCHLTTTQVSRAHLTATQAPPHPDAASLPRKHLGPTSLPHVDGVFSTPSMFITLWFGFDYGTNLPLGTLII